MAEPRGAETEKAATAGESRAKSGEGREAECPKRHK